MRYFALYGAITIIVCALIVLNDVVRKLFTPCTLNLATECYFGLNTGAYLWIGIGISFGTFLVVEDLRGKFDK